MHIVINWFEIIELVTGHQGYENLMGDQIQDESKSNEQT